MNRPNYDFVGAFLDVDCVYIDEVGRDQQLVVMVEEEDKVKKNDTNGNTNNTTQTTASTTTTIATTTTQVNVTGTFGTALLRTI